MLQQFPLCATFVFNLHVTEEKDACRGADLDVSQFSPILGPCFGKLEPPGRLLVTCEMGLYGAGSVGLRCATGLTS